MAQPWYNVVFRNTLASGANGVTTWMSFRTREIFEDYYTDEIRVNATVVEEGVTEERAVELCSTPAAVQAARDYELAHMIMTRTLLS